MGFDPNAPAHSKSTTRHALPKATKQQGKVLSLGNGEYLGTFHTTNGETGTRRHALETTTVGYMQSPHKRVATSFEPPFHGLRIRFKKPEGSRLDHRYGGLDYLQTPDQAGGHTVELRFLPHNHRVIKRFLSTEEALQMKLPSSNGQAILAVTFEWLDSVRPAERYIAGAPWPVVGKSTIHDDIYGEFVNLVTTQRAFTMYTVYWNQECQLDTMGNIFLNAPVSNFKYPALVAQNGTMVTQWDQAPINTIAAKCLLQTPVWVQGRGEAEAALLRAERRITILEANHVRPDCIHVKESLESTVDELKLRNGALEAELHLAQRRAIEPYPTGSGFRQAAILKRTLKSHSGTSQSSSWVLAKVQQMVARVESLVPSGQQEGEDSGSTLDDALSRLQKGMDMLASDMNGYKGRSRNREEIIKQLLSYLPREFVHNILYGLSATPTPSPATTTPQWRLRVLPCSADDTPLLTSAFILACHVEKRYDFTKVLPIASRLSFSALSGDSISKTVIHVLVHAANIVADTTNHLTRNRWEHRLVVLALWGLLNSIGVLWPGMSTKITYRRPEQGPPG